MLAEWIRCSKPLMSNGQMRHDTVSQPTPSCNKLRPALIAVRIALSRTAHRVCNLLQVLKITRARVQHNAMRLSSTCDHAVVRQHAQSWPPVAPSVAGNRHRDIDYNEVRGGKARRSKSVCTSTDNCSAANRSSIAASTWACGIAVCVTMVGTRTDTCQRKERCST